MLDLPLQKDLTKALAQARAAGKVAVSSFGSRNGPENRYEETGTSDRGHGKSLAGWSCVRGGLCTVQCQNLEGG